MEKPQVYQNKKGFFEVGFSSQEKYPTGTFLAKKFANPKDAQQWIEEHPGELTPGIPICSALKEWQALHPYIDTEKYRGD